MTVEEKAWMDAITRLGCCVCIRAGLGASPAEPHHLLDGGRRIGHMQTIPLCHKHHRSGGINSEWTSRHPHRWAFVKRYGSEEELLAWTREQVGKGNA